LNGVENDRGVVRVAVCTPETFATKHCPFSGAMPAHAGKVVVSVDGIPPGRYAVQAYHDEDGNGRIRRGLFGIPAEAIGFSRDAPLRLGPPGSRMPPSRSKNPPPRPSCACGTSAADPAAHTMKG